jgi:prepilin-type N-terminal cleavage/methylation domain-containing protein
MKTVETKINSRRRAFTLIELLAVITIIGVLAAFLVPTIGAVKRHELINKTQAEMAQVETAIDRYKAAYGFYPPDNLNSPLVNQLYFELLGITKYTNSGVVYYQTLDGSGQIKESDVPTAFPGVSGFINCTKPGAGEDSLAARNFLPDLRPNQIGLITNPPVTGVPINVLIGSAGATLWRYVLPGTNNPNSYDLWTQLIIKPGQTNLICNWSRQPQINNPLP